MYICKGALHSDKSAVHVFKRALRNFKKLYVSAKQPYISAKKPCISAKEPYSTHQIPWRCCHQCLYSRKRALCICKRAQHGRKRAPIRHHVAPIRYLNIAIADAFWREYGHFISNANVPAKEPYTSAKNLDASTKEPYISSKEPYISAKEPYISARQLCSTHQTPWHRYLQCNFDSTRKIPWR